MINNIIINHIDFDNYRNHIMISTNKGFIIYSILPFNQKYFMEIKGGIKFGYIHSFEKKIFILNKINPITIDNLALSNHKIILWKFMYSYFRINDVDRTLANFKIYNLFGSQIYKYTFCPGRSHIFLYSFKHFGNS